MLDIPVYNPKSTLVRDVIQECIDEVNKFHNDKGKEFIFNEEVTLLNFKYYLVNKMQADSNDEVDAINKLNNYFEDEEINSTVWNGLKSVFFNGINAGISQILMAYSGENNSDFTILKAENEFPVYMPLSIFLNVINRQVIDEWIDTKYTNQLVSMLHESKEVKSVTQKEINSFLLEPMFRMGVYEGAKFVRDKYYTEDFPSPHKDLIIPREGTELHSIGPFLMGRTIYSDTKSQQVELYQSVIGYKMSVAEIPIGKLTINEAKDSDWIVDENKINFADDSKNSDENKIFITISGYLATGDLTTTDSFGDDPHDDVVLNFLNFNMIRHYARLIYSLYPNLNIAYVEN